MPFADVSEMSTSRLMAIALAAAAAQAAEVPAPATPRSVWVVSLTEENDKFTPQNKDRYYTQGLKIAINRGDHTFFSLTQEINTPSDTTNPNPSLDDMPYSAPFISVGGMAPSWIAAAAGIAYFQWRLSSA